MSRHRANPNASDDPDARHRGNAETRHQVLRAFGYVVVAMSVVVGLFSVYSYRHFNENLTILDVTSQLGDDRPDKVEVEGPREPINVLVMGSDSRDGKGNNIDGLRGGGQRSDTTLLIHLSADRENAYGVSLPRDAMVQRPTCFTKDKKEIPGGFDMWNAAFSVGGPACTIRQFEQLTHVKIDHFVVVDFNGFKDMVDAIDGVKVCIPEDVDDPVGNIHLKAGTREVKGQEALNYVRIRHNISNNGDIGRMKRQQAFVAAMTNKVSSAGTLSRPDRLFGFVNAATSSLTLDPGLSSVKKIADLAGQFQDTGLDKIKFVTIPFAAYEPDPNRLVWSGDADNLWRKVRNDMPLSKRLSTEAITAAGKSKDPKKSAAQAAGTVTKTDEETAAANGLCA
ncbi:LytR family transcriptional regulator [Nocardioides guangzhouensis]|uniref:LytR family transcriptional regulator n=1 Tax=Nocardioides guangzhouensis TaxID=2497878 RepID=A0A4Q4ZBV8_9ACTN|nr:LCP family protein [Nocardioides guangzhouensis]RYP85055.1 LytR family transcriptional regulator [Nocardioides guangzhouensis]